MVVNEAYVVALWAKYKTLIMHMSMKLAAYRAGRDNGEQQVESDTFACFNTGRAIKGYTYAMDLLTDDQLVFFNEILVNLTNRYAPFA